MRGAQCSGERESRDISTALTVAQSSSRNRTNEGEHCGPCCHPQKDCPYCTGQRLRGRSMGVRHVASQKMRRCLRFGALAGLGVAGSVIGLAGVASAAQPLPSLFWTVDPPTLGETHSPNPDSGSTGVSTQISLELATNNDFGSNNAPTGKVTFTDSLGIITGHCKNEAVTPQNLDASYAHCTVTFPTTTTGNDI